MNILLKMLIWFRKVCVGICNITVKYFRLLAYVKYIFCVKIWVFLLSRVRLVYTMSHAGFFISLWLTRATPLTTLALDSSLINIILLRVTLCVLFSLNIFPAKGPRRRLHKQDSTATLMRLIKFYERPLAKTWTFRGDNAFIFSVLLIVLFFYN